MALPRIEIGKILVEVYLSILNKTIINILYNDSLICLDGNTKTIYSPIKPEFMLANLFQCRQINDNTWKFDTTVLYDQLVGNIVSSDSNITYLNSRYRTVEERVKHYVDFTINL